MKYIILIMTITQLKSFWTRFKTIFSTKEQDENELKLSMEKIDESYQSVFESGIDFNSIIVLILALYGLYISLYYALIGLYVGSSLYAILSCVFIIETWQNINGAMRFFTTRDYSVLRKTLWGRIIAVTSLLYVGYLVYYLIINW